MFEINLKILNQVRRQYLNLNSPVRFLKIDQIRIQRPQKLPIKL